MMFRIETFSLSPYIGAMMGLLGHFLLLIYAIWLKKYEAEPKIIENKLWKYFKGIFHLCYMFLSILMIDLSIFWLFGQWIYDDWQYQLPSVLISLIFGIQYLWGALFRSLSRYKIIIFSYLAISTMIIMHWYIPQNMPVKQSFEAISFPIFSALAIISLFALIGLKYSKIYHFEKELANFSNGYEKIFTEIYNWICFFIVLLEVWAKLRGTSIFVL
jgi:hypothetical protein